MSLSKNGQRPWSDETSALSPRRKPSRMPCLTQVLTRQPAGAVAIGLSRPRPRRWRAPRAAARTPRGAWSLSARRDQPRRSRSDVVSQHIVICSRRCCCQQPHRLDHRPDAGPAPLHCGGTIGSLKVRRAGPSGHSALYRDRDSTRRRSPASTGTTARGCGAPPRSRSRWASWSSAAISAGTSFDATEITPCPPTAITGSVSASSPDSTTKTSGHRIADVADLRDVARGFLDGNDVRAPHSGVRASRPPRCTPVRPGNVVDDNRQPDPAAMAV